VESRHNGLTVPLLVRQKALAQGAAGRQWLRDLPVLLGDLACAWDLTLGQVLAGGSESCVVAARTGAGDAVVLKVALPANTGFEREMATLAAADGTSYPRLLARDADRRAIVLERLGPALRTLGFSVAEQQAIICRTLREAWAMPADPRLPSGAEKAASLAEFIASTWAELGRPCPQRIVDQALRHAESRRRAYDPATAVLAHGDPHSDNVLQDPTVHTRFRLVDPDGLYCEAAYDVGVLLRDWNEELLAAADPVRSGREWCVRLGRLSAVDAQAIWEWGYTERVSTGLFCLQLGAVDMGTAMLRIAEAWVEV
jgi:streptomycin 6-kinase